MKILYLGLTILLLGALIFGGCGENLSTTSPTVPTASPTITSSPPTTTAVAPTTAAGPQHGGTFRFIDDRPPSGTLGWFAEPGPPAGSWFQTMFESLCRPQYSGEVKPLLAANWEIADDLSYIVFELQKNVKFHDGSDFNAEVAKWNFDVFIEAHLPAVKDISSVEIIDNYTIKVNLIQYYNTILFSINGVPMVSKAAFDANGVEWMRWNPVGTGPFKFESYAPDQVIKVTKFEDYWQEEKPYLDAIEISWVADPMTAAASFEAGEADAVSGNSPQIMYDLQQKGYEIIYGFTGAGTLIPDSKNEDSPLADIRVRQAIDYAIDREALIKAKGYGYWEVTYQFAAPGTSAYVEDLQVRSYDTEKAKQLLAEAGYGDGLSITIYGDGSSADKDAAVAIQGFLSKVGVTADLQWLDYMGFVQYVMGGWTDGLLFCTNGFAPNMNSAVSFVWSQKAMFFPSVLKTDEMEKLMDVAMATKDVDPALIQTYIRKMHDDAMYLSTYCIIRALAVNSTVHDTGYLQGYGPYTWDPAATWKSK